MDSLPPNDNPRKERFSSSADMWVVVAAIAVMCGLGLCILFEDRKYVFLK